MIVIQGAPLCLGEFGYRGRFLSRELRRHRASFETRPDAAPQDDCFLYRIENTVMLRRLRSGRLEARSAGAPVLDG
jgi:hypothetical protein